MAIFRRTANPCRIAYDVLSFMERKIKRNIQDVGTIDYNE